MKYPYRKINLKHPFSLKPFILRPIIPISLKYQEKTIRYEALIDSGADFNIFPIELAVSLGIKQDKNKKIYFNGIGGNRIEGVILEIYLEVGKTVISTKAVFADVGNGVLGQYGFFDQSKVKFDLVKKEIEVF